MDNKRFSLEEFQALFPGPFASQDQLLREYRSFQRVLEHLDALPVPDLSVEERAEIFRRAWQRHCQDRCRWPPALFRRPVLAFAAGIVLGCTLMFVVMSARAGAPQPRPMTPWVSPAQLTPAHRALTVERTRYTRTYQGRVVEGLYPQIEHPRIVLEQVEESAPPQRVLYGTLDGGEVYVVWNL